MVECLSDVRPDDPWPAPFGTAGGESITGETVSLPLVVTVAHTQPDAATIWDIRVLLADQDITDHLTGSVVIEAEESASRIATVKLLLTGQRLFDLTGKPLVVEMRPNVLASWQRRFTGIVDTPEFGQDRDFVTLHARDRRSESLALSSRAELEALLGGYWSQHVFARYADSLQYATDRLSTIPAAYDLDVYGNPRLTPWAGLASSLTLHAGDIVDESLSIQPSSHKSVINPVTNDNESEQAISTTAICKLSDGKTLTTSTQPTLTGVATPGMTVTVKVGGQTLTATV
ncbi:hypothetical protein [Paludibacterium denitrificans]|uniref:Uncharacterized protein n=1 Tax=Paludibacterium denitrificans TaxID=2675226 RepID=A0A844G821_9NEIS|nr:hypothetical protein [Paludibacterium denitrificans]MTD32506.1 hypothetical protein [Paludibacterium denitrificans]